MVGIILTTHGEFAEGILQSGTMLFGEQKNVKAVTLHPEDSPEDLKKRMIAAISSFDNDDEVLFLVDLWGGTPFNQASSLCDAHKDNWTIVAGLNLPMLIEAYSSRLSMESSYEIAKEILESSKEGIKTTSAVLKAKKKSGAEKTISEETVLGNGKMEIVLTRIDSRLLHGQIATAWTKSTNPNRIIVVSDSVAKDDLRKKLIEQAAPPSVKANVIPISKLVEISKNPQFASTKAMLLFENPQDVLIAIKNGVEIEEVNVGSMAHSVGKVLVNKALSMNRDDITTFEKLREIQVKFDVRKVPNDSSDDIDELLKKAKFELAKQKK